MPARTASANRSLTIAHPTHYAKREVHIVLSVSQRGFCAHTRV